MHNTCDSIHKFAIRVSLIVLVLGVLLFAMSWSDFHGPYHATNGLFQSPLPERRREKEEVPPSWTWASEGGTQQFGPVSVVLPPGFTNQGGANVIGDVLVRSLFVDDLSGWRLLQGTEFALGIWPENDQVEFEVPVELRVTIDSAKLTQNIGDRLIVMLYDPETSEWQSLPSQFQSATLEVVAGVQSFKPVPKDFPSWGGRTFFGVFAMAPTPTSKPTSTARSTLKPEPSATHTPRLTATPKSATTPMLTKTPVPTDTPYPTYTPSSIPTLQATETQTHGAALSPTYTPTLETRKIVATSTVSPARSRQDSKMKQVWIYILIVPVGIVAILIGRRVLRGLRVEKK